jgi:GMP reductase
MKLLDDVKLDFSDVLLLPKRSEYSSRSEVQLEREFTFKHSKQTWKGIPIMVSNMDTTGTIEMARELQQYKIITCLHKYYKASDIPDDLDREYYTVSSGINQKDLENLDEIVRVVNPKFICLDVANGYMTKFIEVCASVREKYPDKIIIAGNVCTALGALDLVNTGKVDICKTGLGNGGACTTRKLTGVGYPQFSCVMECSDAVHGVDAHMISDGGVQVVADFSKAYGGGADFVMCGGVFAGHDESGGELIEENGKKFKLFYGMSSSHAMAIHHGGMAHYRSSEGKLIKMEYKGAVKNTVLDILGGIRSAMTYIGAKRIKDITKCATFIRVNRQLNNAHTGKEI